jgi:zinc/manganese transport system substrate-binding protein
LHEVNENDYHNGIQLTLALPQQAVARARTGEPTVMRSRTGIKPTALATAAVLTTALLASGCASATSGGASGGSGGAGTIEAIGAENEYASVIAQVGGKYVHVDAIMNNPATDPHTYEASPSVAREISQAQLIVQNGVGYDSWATTIENAAPNSSRTVINVQQLLDLPDSTPNPHLWYKPTTMPKVATAIAAALGKIDPAHASYFTANAVTFTASLATWTNAIAAFKAKYPGTPVATTEPVADYMLDAAGADNMTPWTFQADIMNGVDPSPQDVAAEKALFTDRKVKVFLYNQQVTSPLTQSFITAANSAGIPVVGVYETMPVPGYDYQSWMLAEVNALSAAVSSKTSTQHL